MTKKELNHFYKFNIKRSSHFLNFRQINSNYLSSLFCFSLYVLVFFFPIFFLINNILPRKSYSGNIAFVFSRNQKIVAFLLKENFGYRIYDWSTSTFSEKINFFIAFGAEIHLFRLITEINNHEVIRSNLINVIKTIGFYNYVKRSEIKNVTSYYQFNDHSPINFGLEHLFRSQEIKTIYIQHAPVSIEFPPLYHSINLLFSEDSKVKYQISKRCEEVKIICDPRFAFHRPHMINSSKKNVLLCPNLLDVKSEVLATADAFIALNFSVLIRKHPGDKSQWPGLYSYSKNQSIWSDLENNFWVITNESAVPLEAIYNGNLCFKSAFWYKSFDAYGFLKSSLIIKEYYHLNDLVIGVTSNEVTFDKGKLEYYIGNPNSLKWI